MDFNLFGWRLEIFWSHWVLHKKYNISCDLIWSRRHRRRRWMNVKKIGWETRSVISASQSQETWKWVKSKSRWGRKKWIYTWDIPDISWLNQKVDFQVLLTKQLHIRSLLCGGVVLWNSSRKKMQLNFTPKTKSNEGKKWKITFAKI